MLWTRIAPAGGEAVFALYTSETGPRRVLVGGLRFASRNIRDEEVPMDYNRAARINISEATMTDAFWAF